MRDKIRILYIDDYELDRELVKDVLEKEHGGFSVTEASGKQDFEALLTSHEFDVVLSDFNIAGYEGLQVLESVHAYNPGLPVIVVTGTGSEEIAVTALKQGAADYVIKRPKHIQKLPQTILSVLEKQSLKDQKYEAEISLKESEERFRAIATNTPDHVLIQDMDLRYVWVLNPQLGLTEKDMIGKTDFDFLSQEEATILSQQKKKVLETGSTEIVKVSLVSLKGGLQHFDGTYIPRRDSEGRINGLIGYFRNVTDRVKSEETLKESEKKYRDILENVLVGAYQVTLDGKFVFANQKMAEMFGYASCQELEAIDSIADLYVRSEERDKFIDEIVTKGRIIDEFEFKRKDGKHIWVKLHTRKTLDKEGAIIFEGLMEDITEIKKMGTQLLQTHKMDSIGALAGGIAHDFNNVLSSILGYTELSLEDVEKGSQMENNLQEVYAAGNRARELVKQILTFARQTEGELKPIQVGRLAKEVLKFLRSSIPASVEFKESIQSNSLIIADPTQIHQILMNLCTNAAQAMEDTGGVLNVSLSDITLDEYFDKRPFGLRSGDYLKITISDTGVGIPSAHMAKIFEPYFTTKELGEGTGLGLAVVYGIVKSCQGEIIVESEVGKGTVFTVYLPITRKREEIESYTKEALPKGTERILLVDDEPSIAKSSSIILEGLGYQVTFRTSSVEAIEAFKEKPNFFDLVITDMTMPKISGDKLAAELMKIRPDIPIILSTGYSKNLSDKRVAELGIKALLMKPVLKSDLAHTARKVLDDKKG
ncbi:MAG: response regulator [Proteobacteria bacterium]|nr:response regulator [Pseudomonadota bacterium]MBU4469794.1 response regulator [Pseudomonadota bacterium]MCG2753029.1 response regulator [Desulfobacteraceae bacterium]